MPTDLLSAGLAHLADQLNTHAGRAVTYTRAAATVELNATLGRTEFQQVDDQGFVIQAFARDYLLVAADLILSGDTEPTTPAAGDTITETIAGVDYVYEVMSLGNGEVWKYSDPYRNMIRVHCKETSIS
jgi:hypothetical protein